MSPRRFSHHVAEKSPLVLVVESYCMCSVDSATELAEEMGQGISSQGDVAACRSFLSCTRLLGLVHCQRDRCGGRVVVRRVGWGECDGERVRPRREDCSS